MNYVLHISVCAALVVVIVALALYRKWLEDHCDHYVHLHNDQHDTTVIASQQAMCRRIDVLGKLNTGLIVATVLYALAIAGMATYIAWNTQGT